MKIIALCFIVFITISTTMSAQIDITQFNKVGPEAISALLGNPPEQWEDNLYPDCLILGDEEYIEGVCSFGARIVIDDEDYTLTGFDTRSSNFIILSDFINGGVRVGDSISRLAAYDFVHTTYGRNKEGNALKQDVNYPDGTSSYTLFEEEFQSIFFRVQDNIIIEISLSTSEDDPPGYDYTNRLF